MFSRILLSVILVGIMSVTAGAGQSDYSQKVLAQRNTAISDYISETARWDWEKLRKEGYKSVNGEFKAAIDFLYQQDPDTQPFIKFFTTYAVPHELRQKTVYTLSFALHSLVAFSEVVQPIYRPLAVDVDGEFMPYQNVPGSDTLWWIDIRDFGWNNAAFELVTLNDGYFVKPIIDERLAFLLEQDGLSPNIVLRADWFIRHGLDVTKQTDKGLNSIYETLIYSRLNAAPQNEAEYDALWGGGDDDVFYATLITKSQAVGRFNRILKREEGTFGGSYETFDVLFQEGERDYFDDIVNFENNLPRVSDAGEKFDFNQLHLLVYTLRNAAGDIVDFGDPTAVRHSGDILNDVRVRYGHSCIDCHAAGPLPTENALNDLLATGTKLRVPDFDQKSDLEAIYLGEGFNASIKADSQLYTQALEKVNGLTPEQNVANYLAIIEWYERPVSIVQAAVEVGVPPEVFVPRIQGKVGARLATLINDGEGIPRDSWDSEGVDGIPGAFQQTTVVVYNLLSQNIELSFKNKSQINNNIKLSPVKPETRQPIEPEIKLEKIQKAQKSLDKPRKEQNINSPNINLIPVLPSPELSPVKPEPFTHIFIEHEASGWNPGADASRPPQFKFGGPSLWPIYRMSSSGKFIGIKLDSKRLVWLKKSDVQLQRR